MAAKISDLGLIPSSFPYLRSALGGWPFKSRVNFGKVDIWLGWYFCKKLRLFAKYWLTLPNDEILSAYSETIALVPLWYTLVSFLLSYGGRKIDVKKGVCLGLIIPIKLCYP